MAKIEDLVDEIADPALRDRIAREVKDLKETKRFGLVFEEHIPETVSLYGLPIRAGLIVQNRTTPDDLTEYQVLSVENGKAILVPKGAEEPETSVEVDDLLVVKRFHETIYPGLTPVGETRRAPDDKPAHVVINGENFHALQLLTYAYAGKVDCIYIDPPYNTGDKSWKYNNRFVDDNDSYRHSKWLSFIEKRLKLARSLLAPDGVLIVTIDEHEIHHLGVLLEELFPEAERQMVTIVTSSKGSTRKQLFSRVEEHALFCFMGQRGVVPLADNFLTPVEDGSEVEWESLLRRGSEASRDDRPGMFYPILIDADEGRIIDVGDPLPDGVEPDIRGTLNGLRLVWPIRKDLSLGRWRIGPETCRSLLAQGYLRLGRRDKKRKTWTVLYLQEGKRDLIEEGRAEVRGYTAQGYADVHYVDEDVRRPRTVWFRPSHSAGDHGSSLLRRFLGGRRFDYPKSLYATADALATIVRNDRSAVILDFFAGSATTLHSTMLLNAQDGGERQCILVTNNDVSEGDAVRMNAEGKFVGDSAYEAEGIFESVARPRIEAAVTGHRPDGSAVNGSYLDDYLDGYAFEDGFEENVRFLKLEYLDPDYVALGRQFNAIAPLLWMAAGSVGSAEEWDGKAPWSIPTSSTYAVLFDEEQINEFSEAVVESGVTHVWLVTNSHSAYTEMRQRLPDDLIEVRQLYADYLRNFTLQSGLLRP